MMTKTTRITLVLAVVMSVGLSAQEKLGSGAPAADHRAGWTFTPTLGFAEAYDDNVSLFGRNTAEGQRNDYISTIFPAADLHYGGKHTMFDVGYTGSFLDYRTLSILNRWDQRARFELRRQETARLKWSGRAAAAMIPTTDLVELGGIPFRHMGARTADGRAGVEYTLSATDSILHTLSYQLVDFDRSADVRANLRGGRVFESSDAWRHKFNGRLAVGMDYSFRRASVIGDLEPFYLHTTEAAVDYELSPLWGFSGGAGVVYLQDTALTAARTGPAWRASLERHAGGRSFHVGYIRSYIPSFGFGGTIQNQEVGVGFRTPIFGSRRFYTDNSAVFRDNQPLTATGEQLPLRSLRTYSIIGWEPQPWVRFEAFYARVQQSSLRAGGRLDRNRVGFQIVTSKPMRMQ
jgi:hypothetical protein